MLFVPKFPTQVGTRAVPCVEDRQGVMLARMRHSRDTGRLPASSTPPSAELPSAPGGRPRFRQKNPRHQNPSLDRYSDLRYGNDVRRGHRRWAVLLAVVLSLGPLLILGVMAAIYWEARHDEARPVDGIVVMGAAQYNGDPSPVLEARLDHALELYRQGLAPVIIVTGGSQPGDIYTEAGASEQYLINRGVPPGAILSEATGRDTWASMQNVARVTSNTDIDTLLVVSDGFHLFRSERMAEAVGFDAYSSAATNSPIEPWSASEFSYVIRETGAVVVQAPDWLF